MPVNDAYETAANYRAAINKVDTGQDGAILTDLTAVTRYMERHLGRFFTKDASAVDRDYIAQGSGPVYPEAENPYRYVSGANVLYVDDMAAAPVSVLVDDNDDGVPETAYTAYQLLPLNATKGPEARPYTALQLADWSSHQVWPPHRLVRVNAVFGWPAIPESIKRACIHLTAILRLETPRAQRAVSDTGEILGASTEARGIIRDLMKPYGKASL